LMSSSTASKAAVSRRVAVAPRHTADDTRRSGVRSTSVGPLGRIDGLAPIGSARDSYGRDVQLSAGLWAHISEEDRTNANLPGPGQGRPGRPAVRSAIHG
jgi:hypothetical protein